MNSRIGIFFWLRVLACLAGSGILLAGCAAPSQRPASVARVRGVEAGSALGVSGLARDLEARILDLNPEDVSDQEVREVLAAAPAPRLINIHGGLLPLKGRMISFSQFLIGMGYPEASIRDPGNGTFTYGWYDNSDRIAGTIAWHYEREGLRPMLVGHSLGGIQAIRVLHKLAGSFEPRLPVWNPLTGDEERRYEITDPLTGKTRPVVGLQVSFASAAVSGGLARTLPTEWDMNTKLRDIPDSVEEFTGFQKGFDPLGGDYFGYGSANDYRSTGTAVVRNVRLPAAGAHLTIPSVRDLLNEPNVRDWINHYHPIRRADTAGIEVAANPEFGLKSARALWAAEVWHGIKKHWVRELQRLIRARSAIHHP